LTVGGKPIESDLVKVVVVSNTLVIGIDGTGSARWLAKKDAKGNLVNERPTPDGARWNSHVRNLVADSEPFAMTIYEPGPPSTDGSESDDIFWAVRNLAEGMIQDAGGGTSIALVGFSRGAMIASGAANALANTPAGALPRNVVFVGMYDPVDMSAQVNDDWARIGADVKAVMIVGPTGPGSADEDAVHNNVDYDGFARMANRNIWRRWLIGHAGTVIIDRRTYNASHGSIGGTPGYNDDNLEPPRGVYDYAEDRRNSILSDQDIRAAMRGARLEFVPDRNAAWYGFPATRPPEDLWE
jgi:hypothetical protein